MGETLAKLRFLRGETSQPLRDEIKVMLNRASEDSTISCAVQVESTMLLKGISLLVDFTQPTVVRLYVSRKEIPGFLPPSVKQELLSLEWEIYNDVLGEEFVLVYRMFDRGLDISIEDEVTKALETLGAPKKHIWKLHPVYS